jgi:hypothetical protein
VTLVIVIAVVALLALGIALTYNAWSACATAPRTPGRRSTSSFAARAAVSPAVAGGGGGGGAW